MSSTYWKNDVVNDLILETLQSVTVLRILPLMRLSLLHRFKDCLSSMDRLFHCWLIVFERSAWRLFFAGDSAAPSSCWRSSQHLRRNRIYSILWPLDVVLISISGPMLDVG